MRNLRSEKIALSLAQLPVEACLSLVSRSGYKCCSCFVHEKVSKHWGKISSRFPESCLEWWRRSVVLPSLLKLWPPYKHPTRIKRLDARQSAYRMRLLNKGWQVVYAHRNARFSITYVLKMEFTTVLSFSHSFLSFTFYLNFGICLNCGILHGMEKSTVKKKRRNCQNKVNVDVNLPPSQGWTPILPLHLPCLVIRCSK